MNNPQTTESISVSAVAAQSPAAVSADASQQGFDLCASVLQSHQFDLATMEDLEACASAGRDIFRAGVKTIGQQVAFAYATTDLKQKMLSSQRLMSLITTVQNDPMWFKADQTYPAQTVAACLIKASLMGLPWTGNCFNIISGQFYLTKEGLDWLLCDMGIPHIAVCSPYRQGETIKGGIDRNGRQMADINMVVIPVDLQWEEEGQEHEQRLEFQVRMNANTTPDNVNGKATRKAYKWLYDRICSRRGARPAFRVEDGEAEITPMAAAIPARNFITAEKAKEIRSAQTATTIGARICEKVSAALEAIGSDVKADELIGWLSRRGTPVACERDAQALIDSLEGTVEAYRNAAIDAQLA